MASPTHKKIRAALYGLAAIAVLAQVYFAFIHPRLFTDAGTRIGEGDYQLVATNGEAFTEETLKGHPSIVYFGFTHCPEVCPTTMGDVATWQAELGEVAEDLQVYFITVDPERDTLELLDGYVGWLDNGIGVTGTVEEVRKAEKSFRIYSAKVPLSDGEYTMDHSAHILLFDENGRFFEPIQYQEDLELALDKLRRMLGA